MKLKIKIQRKRLSEAAFSSTSDPHYSEMGSEETNYKALPLEKFDKKDMRISNMKTEKQVIA